MALVSDLCESVIAAIVRVSKVFFGWVLISPLVNPELEDGVVLWVGRLISYQEAKSRDSIEVGASLASQA